MGNKRLKKREHSLKGLGRRSLSLLMAMVMTLSLVQISAFAEADVAENQPNPLEPETVKNVNDHGIDLTKTACGHYYEEEHEHSGNKTCYYRETKDSKWTAYPSRLSAAKSAMSTLEGNLPNGANVQYVSFSSKAKQETSLDDVKAKGGTNIMAGVDKGIDLLNQNQSTVTKKVLVLLSDGEDDNGNYSSDKLKNFNGDVYTVGFAVDNQNLKGMIKGDGGYIYAKNAEALNTPNTEMTTPIPAKIVDPKGDELT